jgi:hypothetical protein
MSRSVLCGDRSTELQFKPARAITPGYLNESFNVNNVAGLVNEMVCRPIVII